MNRLTETHWRNLDPWECCGQDDYCKRGCHDDGGCTKGCIVPKLYDRLAAYEDTGLEPEEIVDLRRAWDMYGGEEGIMALLDKPNDPLTPEELREMDGEPVWVCHPLDKRSGAWALVDIKFDMCRVAGGGIAVFENCGKIWLAYRRKPEEVQ